MNRISTLAAAAVLFFLSSIVAAPVAHAQASNAVSARAPGFSAPVRQPTPDQVPGIAAAFPNEGWATRTAMPTARWAHAVVSDSLGSYPSNNAFVYVISGADATFANTGLLSRYDVNANVWSDRTALSPARSQIGAARIGGKIYVPGGYASSFSPTNALSIYDIANNVWTTGAAMPQATGDYAIGVYANRYLYVIAGYSGSADLNSVQVYDSANNTWTTATPKTGTAVAGIRGGIVGNHIVVTGGYSQSLASEVADTLVGTIDPVNPTAIVWSAAAPYPGGTVGRLGAGVPVAAGPAQGASALNVVIFTGGDPNGAGTAVKNDTWMFDFNDLTWKSGPVKPSAVSNIDTIAGVASGGKLYMVSTGGYNGSAIIAVNEWLGLGSEAPPDLALTGFDGGLPISRGGSVVYNFTYTVTGIGTASSVTISDTVPAGTSFKSAGSSAGWVCTPDNSAGSACSISLGTLVSGNSGLVSFALDSIAPVAPGVTQIVNSAVISTVATIAPEQNLANNVATVTTQYLPPSIVAVTAGSAQSATVSTAFSAPLAVHVTDSNGNPQSGVSVSFTAPATGASATLSAPSMLTDINGDASVTATANTLAGAYAVSASLTDFVFVAPASFALTNTAGAAATVSVIGGSPQSAVVGTVFSTALEVRVADAFGNAVASASVDFNAPASGVSALLSAASAITDSSGNASVTATANTTAGSYSVGASTTGAASASFALTNDPGAPSTMSISGGSPQSATVGTAFAAPLGVQVLDQYGNSIEGVAVGFTAPGTGPSALLSSPSVLTDGNGLANLDATANAIAGTYSVTANLAGIAPIAFALTNTAAEPQALSIIAGSPQSTSIGTVFPVPLSVQVRDANNNLVGGVEVGFSAPASGASATLSTSTVTTDVNGIATVTAIANNQTGVYAVTASTVGVATSASFSLTNLPADVDLSVSIDDRRDYAQYGRTLDYIVTLNNAGNSDAHHVNIASTLPEQIDVPFAQWICIANATYCVTSGAGNLSDTDVTVPSHQSIAWVLSAPILFDAVEAPVVTAVTASSADQIEPANASDTTTPVIFREGFDQPYGSGSEFEPLGLSLRSGASVKVQLPAVTGNDPLDTVLVAHGPQSSGFHLDRLTYSTGTWLRLVTDASGNGTQMTPWLRLDSSHDIVLNLAASEGVDGVVLQNGLQSERLDLRYVGDNAVYRLERATQ